MKEARKPERNVARKHAKTTRKCKGSRHNAEEIVK